MLSVKAFPILLLLCKSIAAQDSTYFVQPPEAGTQQDYSQNPTYTLGSKVELQWITSMQTYTMYLGQMNLTSGDGSIGGPIFTRVDETGEQDETRSYSWTVGSQDFKLKDSNVYYLALALNDNLDGVVVSHTFNISTTPVAQTTPINVADVTTTQQDDSDAELTVRRTVTVADDSSSLTTSKSTTLDAGSTSSAVFRTPIMVGDRTVYPSTTTSLSVTASQGSSVSTTSTESLTSAASSSNTTPSGSATRGASVTSISTTENQSSGVATTSTKPLTNAVSSSGTTLSGSAAGSASVASISTTESQSSSAATASAKPSTSAVSSSGTTLSGSATSSAIVKTTSAAITGNWSMSNTVTKTLTVTRMFYTESPSTNGTSTATGSSSRPFQTGAASSFRDGFRCMTGFMMSFVVGLSTLLSLAA